MLKKISVEVGDQLLAEIKRCAKDESRTLSGWVRLVLIHELTRSAKNKRAAERLKKIEEDEKCPQE